MVKEITNLQPLSFIAPFLKGNTLSEMKEAQVENNVVIFYIPHQDTEILTMGPSILKNISRGFDVHLVFYATQTNDEFKDYNKNIYEHNKKQFHSKSVIRLLDKKTFLKAKNEAFVKSSVALGVKEENIHFYYEEGQAKEEDLKYIIEKFESSFPGARHKSMSFLDENENNSKWGKVLVELYKEHKVSNVNFYVETKKHDEENSVPFKIEKIDGDWVRKLEKAAKSYQSFDPSEGKYVKAYSMIRENIDRLLKYPVSVVHGPDHII